MDPTRYIDLAKTYAARFAAGSFQDDCAGAALLALVEFCEKNPGDETPHLLHLLRRRLHGAVLDELRNQDPLSRRHRAAVKGGECAAPEFCDIEDASAVYADAENPDTAAIHTERKTQLLDAIAALRGTKCGDKQHKVLMLELAGKTRFEIAAELGVTHQRVQQIVAAAHSKLRKKLWKENDERLK